MTWHRVLGSRIRALFGARQLDRDLDDELRSHIEMETEANLSRGMSPREARRAALIEFGGLAQTAEAYRDGRGLQWLETLLQDIRYALRGFRKAPGFTAVAILSLALGIGVNTVIFSMVNMVLLRPLPVEDPGRLAVLSMQQPGSLATPVLSYPDYHDVREASAVFSDALAYRTGLDGLSVNGHADRIVTHYVTGNYFTMLGVKPAVGRLILPSEGDVDGADPVVVLSYSYWKTRFGGDPNIAGKPVLIDGRPATIVGVAPKQFHGVQPMLDVQGYLPLPVESMPGFRNIRALRFLYVMTRLKNGVTFQQAQTSLNVVSARLARANPVELGGVRLYARPETLTRIPGADDGLTGLSTLFLAMAAVVLLLASVNLANLVMVRTSVRRKEIAMRAALGGSRGRLIRQLLTENIILAFFGGIAGMLLGAWTSGALGGNLKFQGIPIFIDFSFDWRVYAYAFAATLASGLMLGMLPAARASRADLTAVSRQRGRFSPGRNRVRSVLVMAQIAASLVLLVLAGLFARSLQNARKSDLGFDPNNVVNLSVDPHAVGYDEAQGRRFYRDLLRRVRSLPGVESASLGCCGPIGAIPMMQPMQIEGYTPPKGQTGPSIFYNHVSPDFFTTLRIPILRGRAFNESDGPNSPDIAIVNQTMSNLYWPGLDPIGRRFQFAAFPGHWMKVAGVARDGKYVAIGEPALPYFYLSADQNYFPLQTLRIRSRVSSDVMLAEARKAVASIEPLMPVYGEETMTQQLEGARGFLTSKLPAWLATVLGMLGLVLALIGLYGVVSYNAVQQTHEIGVRMALGAHPREIRKLVLGQGVIVACVGVVAGVVASLAVGPLVRQFLVDVSATDPPTIVFVTILLAVVTLLACYVPAKRAMRVDPVVALRHE